MQVATESARIFIPMGELIDKDKELDRLTREKTACEKDIAQLSAKANNESFIAKAPAHVVDEIKSKLAKAEELLAKIEESIKAL